MSFVRNVLSTTLWCTGVVPLLIGVILMKIAFLLTTKISSGNKDKIMQSALQKLEQMISEIEQLKSA